MNGARFLLAFWLGILGGVIGCVGQLGYVIFRQVERAGHFLIEEGLKLEDTIL